MSQREVSLELVLAGAVEQVEEKRCAQERCDDASGDTSAYGARGLVIRCEEPYGSPYEKHPLLWNVSVEAAALSGPRGSGQGG